MKSLLLVFLLLIGILGRADAQSQNSPQFGFVDVLPYYPSFREKPKGTQLDFELLIGAWPRPAWWGQNFDFNKALRSGAVALKLKTGEGSDVPLRTAVAGRPVWRETWQLYTVHVVANLAVAKWPNTASFSLAGGLPDPFAQGPNRHEGMLFTLHYNRLSNGSFEPSVAEPKPRIWIKSARVIKRIWPQTDEENKGFDYELNVVCVDRILVEDRFQTLGSLTFLDAEGQPFSPMGMYGGGGQLGQEDVSGEFDTMEQTTFRLKWNETAFASKPTFSVRTTFEFNKHAPLTITIPVKRDGVLLDGEISTRDWTIEGF